MERVVLSAVIAKLYGTLSIPSVPLRGSFESLHIARES